MATTRVEPAVCFGSSQRSWVTDLINYVSDHGGMRVVGTVLTQDDAIQMAFDVLVIDDVSSVLSPRLVDRLHASKRIVIGVYDAERGSSAHERLMQTADVPGRRRVRRTVQRSQAFMRDCVERAQAQGSIHPQVSPWVIVWMITGVVRSAVAHSTQRRRAADVDVSPDALWADVVRAIRCRA